MTTNSMDSIGAALSPPIEAASSQAGHLLSPFGTQSVPSPGPLGSAPATSLVGTQRACPADSVDSGASLIDGRAPDGPRPVYSSSVGDPAHTSTSGQVYVSTSEVGQYQGSGQLPTDYGFRPNVVAGIRPNIPLSVGQFPGSSQLPADSGFRPNFVTGIRPNIPLSTGFTAPQGLDFIQAALGQLVQSVNNMAAGAVPQGLNSALSHPGAQQPAGPSSSHTYAASALDARPASSSQRLPTASVDSSEVGSEDDDPDVRAPPGPVSFSFRDAVPLLLENFPELAGDTTSTENSEHSLSGIALGLNAAEAERPSLKESAFISSAMEKALKAVRGQKGKGKGGVSADNVPNFPSALHCGTFLPLDRLPFDKNLVDRHSIPDSSMQATSEDLSLVQEGSKSDKRTVSLTDRTAADFEENVRRSLETVSVLDSFMAGFIMSVRHPDSPKQEFQIREEMDTECLGSFASASVVLIQYLAGNLSKILTNLRLSRKDGLLVNSSHSKEVRASLRAAPPDPDGSFFGSCASSSIEHEAKLRRDLHFMQPPQPPQRQSRPSGGRTSRFDRPSFNSNRQSSRVNVRTKQKTQSYRFRPYPPQDSQRHSSRGKGDKHRSSRKGGHPQ